MVVQVRLAVGLEVAHLALDHLKSLGGCVVKLYLVSLKGMVTKNESFVSQTSNAKVLEDTKDELH